MDKPREYTEKEFRDIFLEHIWDMVEYWSTLEEKEEKDKLQGLAFSILSMLDGSNAELPRCIVAPDPNRNDRAWYESRKENFFPYNGEHNIKANVAGSLHDNFYSIGIKLGFCK